MIKLRCTHKELHAQRKHAYKCYEPFLRAFFFCNIYVVSHSGDCVVESVVVQVL